MSKSTRVAFVPPQEVLDNLSLEAGKPGGYYIVAHQGGDTMSVIVKDNKLVQIPISAELQEQHSKDGAGVHPVGTKVWYDAEGKLLAIYTPTFTPAAMAKSQGCNTARTEGNFREPARG